MSKFFGRQRRATTAPTYELVHHLPRGVPALDADERLLLITLPKNLALNRPTNIQVSVEGRPYNVTCPPRSRLMPGRKFYARVRIVPQAPRPPFAASGFSTPARTGGPGAAQAVGVRNAAGPSGFSETPQTAPPAVPHRPPAGATLAAPPAPAYDAPPPAYDAPPPAYAGGMQEAVAAAAVAPTAPPAYGDVPLAAAAVVDPTAAPAQAAMPVATVAAAATEAPAAAAAAAPAALSVENPFASYSNGGENGGGEAGPITWLPGMHRNEYMAIFQRHGPAEDGTLSPDRVRVALMATGAPMEVLREVWEIADADRSGKLDFEEFALALFLVQQANAGQSLPDRSRPLPPELMPPSHRSRA